MPEGKIKKLVADKGFGFIETGNGGKDIFFHCSAVEGTFESLVEGQTVEYDEGMGSKGPRAENVRMV